MDTSGNCSTLEAIWQFSLKAPEQFVHKAILFIGSESYDAPTITVLQGLQALGWRVYTLFKPNINSWFVNEVIEDPSHLKFDFVLSNLAWGTRWSYYDRFNLHNRLCVLIDGDDDRNRNSWREKYEEYKSRYEFEPDDEIKDLVGVMPFRWIEDISRYEPHVVFTSQRCKPDSCYLPFGIQREYNDFYSRVPLSQRRIDYAHFPGPGIKRGMMSVVLRKLELGGVLHNEKTYGQTTLIATMRDEVVADYHVNIHGYHRWTFPRAYFGILNNAKLVIYPGCTQWYWESKRQYEALSQGALLLVENPGPWTAQYPIQELWPWGFYDTLNEFQDKIFAIDNGEVVLSDILQRDVHWKAQRYFGHEPIARYFLWRILE